MDPQLPPQDRKRILFVDDEVAILRGLHNLLRRERGRWDMTFAAGAEEALKELATAPFDVVVSDMRMPGMDGAALLTEVKRLHPATVRLVLSGHAERAAVLKTLSVAHQFLSKPCDADLLRVTIERTCGLHKLLADENIRRIAGSLEGLPSVPQTYLALTEAAANPNIGLADIAQIVQSDPAMSAKILQLVNSAYFGCVQRVVSITQAVSYLGLELIKGLALTAQIFSSMKSDSIEGFSLDRLRDGSLLVARMAKKFVLDPKLAEEAFTAGLVHDIGRIIIALGLPDRFGEVVKEAHASHRPYHDVEKEILGVSHAEVGAYLLGVWGLPFSIVESVAYHHRPSAIAGGPCELAAAVHAADTLVDQTWQGAPGSAPDRGLDMPFLEQAGLTAQVPGWVRLAEQEPLASKGARPGPAARAIS